MRVKKYFTLLCTVLPLKQSLMRVTLFPYSKLDHAQRRDASIKKTLQQPNSCNYYNKDFHGGGKTRSLVCYNEKIAVPSQLQKHVIDWYHTVLCHPGINRTEETISQHLYILA